MAHVKFVAWIGKVPPWAQPWWRRHLIILVSSALSAACVVAAALIHW